MIPLGCLDKLAPAELGIEPDEVEVKLGCKGLHYLRLHSTLDDGSGGVVGCGDELHDGFGDDGGGDGDGNADHSPVQPSRTAKPDEGDEMADGSDGEVFLLPRI